MDMPKNLKRLVENQHVLKSHFQFVRLHAHILKCLAALERWEVGKGWASVDIEKSILWVHPRNISKESISPRSY